MYLPRWWLSRLNQKREDFLLYGSTRNLNCIFKDYGTWLRYSLVDRDSHECGRYSHCSSSNNTVKETDAPFERLSLLAFLQLRPPSRYIHFTTIYALDSYITPFSHIFDLDGFVSADAIAKEILNSQERHWQAQCP